jgi:hypothetical protein
VRVVCKGCGWYRNIAHTGCVDGKRALVSIFAAPDHSHVLHAKVIEVSEDLPLDAVLRDNPGYRDLVHEAHLKGLCSMEREFQPLLKDRVCPRCATSGKLELSQCWHLGAPHVRY